MHIRAYLFMMAAGILVPVVLFSSLALSMLKESGRDAALGALNETANALAQRVDRELYSAEAALLVLSASPSLAAQDYEAYYDLAKVTNSANTVWHVLLDQDGQQLINTSVSYGQALPTSLTLGQASHIRTSGKTVVSNVRRGVVSGRLGTTVSIPLALPNGRSYILSQTLATDHFVHIIKGIRVPPGWLVAIVDGNGNFVARNINSEQRVGTPARPELVAALRGAFSGQIRHRTHEYMDAYDVFTHSSMSGWGVAVAAPVDSIERSAREASLVAAMGLLAATLGAIALAVFFGRLHVRSMSAAVKAAIDLGNGIAPGRLHSRVLEVNELHAALHAAGEQMVQAQAYRKHTEAERQALLEREQHTRVMAEQQNTAKDQFLAMLGHELRNPLAPISTAAQLLKLQATDPARVRYASDVIARQVAHMNSLLGDMLDVSRVTRGLVSLSLAPVDLRGVIERAVEQTLGLIEMKHHQLVIDMPEAPAVVNGDQTRLIQIFANLLNNAAKYTPPNGRIEVQLTTAGAMIRVAVRDNGEGFSAELAPRIFDLFSQGERQPDRSQGGLGLGLALVKSLVNLHGGTVQACSAGPGQGSEFMVALPRDEGVQQPAPPAPLTPATSKPLRIMIVDDNIDGALSLSLLLQQAGGHQTSTYYDASAALHNAALEQPDVFILDIGLPDINGYELARRLKAMPACAGAIYIALTGYGQPQDKERAAQAGFDHHLAKPADPHAIVSLLGQLAQAR